MGPGSMQCTAACLGRLRLGHWEGGLETCLAAALSRSGGIPVTSTGKLTVSDTPSRGKQALADSHFLCACRHTWHIMHVYIRTSLHRYSYMIP